jgi:SagB-type dehydrogenase family enzyme
MSDVISWLRMTQLDQINAREFAARIAEAEANGFDITPRNYPGYPSWALPHVARRWRVSLGAALRRRRCCATLETTFPDPKTLGEILESAHGITGDGFRGPTPSAGGLQALELYFAHWQDGWLPPGVYHYDRRGHALSQINAGADESDWRRRIPSMHQISGGALLWIIVGETRRVAAKYGERADRFLLLEAGALMQNLCLVSTSLRHCTVPLGGCLELEIARALQLLPSDVVLYAGLCGKPGRE